MQSPCEVCALVTAKAAEAEARSEFSDAACAAVKSVVDGTAPKVQRIWIFFKLDHVFLNNNVSNRIGIYRKLGAPIVTLGYHLVHSSRQLK